MNFDEARKDAATAATKNRLKQRKMYKNIARITAVVIGILIATIGYISVVGDLRSSSPDTETTGSAQSHTAACPGKARTLTIPGDKPVPVNPNFCQTRQAVRSGCVYAYNVDGQILHGGKPLCGKEDVDGIYAYRAVSGEARVRLNLCPPRSKGNYLEHCN